MAKTIKRKSHLALKAPSAREPTIKKNQRCAPSPLPRTPPPASPAGLRTSSNLGALAVLPEAARGAGCRGQSRGFPPPPPRPQQGGAGEKLEAGGERAQEPRGRTDGGARRGVPGRAATRAGQRCARRGPRAGGPAFSCKAAAGAGRAPGGGACHARLFPLRLFASLLIPGRKPRNSCGPGRAEAGGAGSGEAAARWPGHRAPAPPALSGRAPRAPPEEAKVCRQRVAARAGRRAEGSGAPLASRYCSPTSRLPSAVPPPRRPGAEGRARLGGHGRGPEQGRGAGAGSSSPGAAALRGADLPARGPHTPPCSARAPPCGWSCR